MSTLKASAEAGQPLPVLEASEVVVSEAAATTARRAGCPEWLKRPLPASGGMSFTAS